MQIDQHRRPRGLQRRFSSAAVARLAPSVAVDDQPQQPFDAGPHSLEVSVLVGIG
jgi:hypothetical protein